MRRPLLLVLFALFLAVATVFSRGASTTGVAFNEEDTQNAQTLDYDSRFRIMEGQTYNKMEPGVPKKDRPVYTISFLSTTPVKTDYQLWPNDDQTALKFPDTFSFFQAKFQNILDCERDEEVNYYFSFKSACDGKPVQLHFKWDPLPDSHHSCALSDNRYYITVVDGPTGPDCFTIRTTFGWDYGYHKSVSKVGDILEFGMIATKSGSAGIEIIGADSFNSKGSKVVLDNSAKALTGPFNVNINSNTLLWTIHRGYPNEQVPKGWNWENGPFTYSHQTFSPINPSDKSAGDACEQSASAFFKIESRCRDPVTDYERYVHLKLEWLPLLNDKCQVIQNRYRLAILEGETKTACVVVRSTSGWSFGGWQEIDFAGQSIDFGQDDNGMSGNIEIIGNLAQEFKKGMDA